MLFFLNQVLYLEISIQTHMSFLGADVAQKERV